MHAHDLLVFFRRKAVAGSLGGVTTDPKFTAQACSKLLSFQPLPINVTNKIARSCLASHPSQFKLMERTALSLPLLAASYHGQQAECNRCLRHHRRQSRNFRRLRTCTCACTCTCAPWVLQAEIGCGISSHLFYRVPGACTSAFCLLPRPTHGQHPVGRRRLQTLAGHAGFAHLAPLQSCGGTLCSSRLHSRLFAFLPCAQRQTDRRTRGSRITDLSHVILRHSLSERLKLS